MVQELIVVPEVRQNPTVRRGLTKNKKGSIIPT